MRGHDCCTRSPQETSAAARAVPRTRRGDGAGLPSAARSLAYHLDIEGAAIAGRLPLGQRARARDARSPLENALDLPLDARARNRRRVQLLYPTSRSRGAARALLPGGGDLDDELGRVGDVRLRP